ncbi:MAG: DUF1015 family protein [Syntrophomonadaceae bacterium]|nr:DUF1015 family protein [Syntrophomonadaceae bacterium]
MTSFRPFPAWRPAPELADKVAALPYDVMSSAEARIMVQDNPYSFLHVDKAEIDLDPAIDLYDPKVYAQAAATLQRMMDEGIFVQEAKPCYYIYRQHMGEHVQTGLVGAASIDDYLRQTIKKHEFTRPDKEADRTRHVDVCDAQTGPIFLSHRADAQLKACLRTWAKEHDRLYDIDGGDGIRHVIWAVDDDDTIAFIRARCSAFPCMYIADGHHRAASAVNVGQMRREAQPGYSGDEEFNSFLAVAFPDDELQIFDYNRLLKDLNGRDLAQIIAELERIGFTVTPYTAGGPCRPPSRHSFGMYAAGQWYLLKADGLPIDDSNPVACLDVSILQDHVLAPLFAIDDPRTSQRIDFVGGIRGLEELSRRVDSGEMALAFALYPTGMDELMAIADAGQVMPPKSTWFEPKLRSGIFIHRLR